MEDRVDIEGFISALWGLMPRLIKKGKRGWLSQETYDALPFETKFALTFKLLKFIKEFQMETEAAMNFIDCVLYKMQRERRDFYSLPLEKQYALAIQSARLALSYFPREQ
ncbi:MAG: hypothetical protein Q8M83_03535 [bacterium]|nr:hypothetical protein [bacterium]